MPIQRGDIYFVNLNPVQGREQAGQRPVLVLSIDALNRLPLVVTVMVGTKGDNVSRDYPTNVRLSPAETGLPIPTVSLGVTYALAHTYGSDDGRIWSVRCAVIVAGLD